MVATRSRRRKEKPGQYIPGPMDHQLVPVRRLVLLMSKTEYDTLPGESHGLHLCEEALIVPGDLATPTSPPPASPTSAQCAPSPASPQCAHPGPDAPPQCAQPRPDAPTHCAQETDLDQVKSTTLASFSINNVVIDVEEPYYCSDCAVKEALIFGDKYRL